MYAALQASLAAVFTTVAFAMDLHRQKISNYWILAGWILGICLQIIYDGWTGAGSFFIGAGVPVLWLFVLFYFRMLGPGDIKLLSVLGGLLGYRAAICLIIFSFFFGGILSLGLLITSGTMRFRFRYFAEYFKTYFKTREHTPYYRLGEQAENIHFTLPILLGVFLYVGGAC